MRSAVVCTDICKTYDKTVALNGININMEENKIYGLLGRNGAGKSTLLKIISNHIFPTRGNVEIFSEAPYENENALGKICFVREKEALLKDFKVSDLFYNASRFYKNYDKNFEKRLIKEFNIDTSKRLRALSSGMNSSVGIIIALSSRAPITIFDEPYTGLDAAARQRFYDILVEDYAENPRTFILSTHLIEEESKLFENVIILDRGNIILTEDCETIALKSHYISGNREIINDYIKDRKTVHVEDMGFTKIAAIYEELNNNEKQQLLSKGLTISQVPLQKMFIYLTNV